jgi:PEP-CTERM motif-containing protein
MTAKRIGILLALTAALIAPVTSQAIILTVDNPNQTVLRPTTGFVDVTFTGTIGITPGFELISGSATSLWNASGDLIAGVFPDFAFGVGGILFTVRVGSTDLGLYNLDSTLLNPARVGFAECPIVGGFCNNAFTTYSVNVVDSLPVPEPSTLSLFGIAALLVGVSLRRRSPAASQS